MGMYCSQDPTQLKTVESPINLEVLAYQFQFITIPRKAFDNSYDLEIKLSAQNLKIYVNTDLNNNLPSKINSLKDFELDATSKSATGVINLGSDFENVAEIENNENWKEFHFGNF